MHAKEVAWLWQEQRVLNTARFEMGPFGPWLHCGAGSPQLTEPWGAVDQGGFGSEMSTRPQTCSWPLLPSLSCQFPSPCPCAAGMCHGHTGFTHLLQEGKQCWVQLEHHPWLRPSQCGQAVPLPAFPVPALGLMPVVPLAVAAAVAEPGQEQPPVPAASGPPSLLLSLFGGFSLPPCLLVLLQEHWYWREGVGCGAEGSVELWEVEGGWSLQAEFMDVHHWRWEVSVGADELPPSDVTWQDKI